jgi:isopentenyl-diphosphate delta-isomerase
MVWQSMSLIMYDWLLWRNPVINPEEVEDWKWMAIDDVKDDMQAHPEIYTVWFKIIFDEFIIF